MMGFHGRDWGFGYRSRLQTHTVSEQGYASFFRCKKEREKPYRVELLQKVSLSVIRPQIETNAF